MADLSCVLTIVLVVVIGGGAAAIVAGIAKDRGEEYGIKFRK